MDCGGGRQAALDAAKSGEGDEEIRDVAFVDDVLSLVTCRTVEWIRARVSQHVNRSV